MTKPDDDTPIIELRNLGPACEEQMQAVGIRTAGDIRRLGVKEAFELTMRGRMQRGKGGGCFNAAYLYAMYGAIHDLDWRAIPEKKKTQFKAFTQQLRDDG